MGLLPAHVSVHYLCAWSRRRLKEGIVSPGMELWMSVGHHVDAGNGTQVCYKSSWCSSAKPSLSPIKSMTFLIIGLASGYQTQELEEVEVSR